MLVTVKPCKVVLFPFEIEGNVASNDGPVSKLPMTPWSYPNSMFLSYTEIRVRSHLSSILHMHKISHLI